ncbi:hypothetical protein [Curtobacterium sp. MCBD17_008]|uniref:terminase small subunit n=1 Tax=Curtobacterium sp. MCBD17_008 TaxID=2175656 RepID=UPI0011B372F4|nr:hypothetical protein [Curtobacterium sp. MCBD17_008]
MAQSPEERRAAARERMRAKRAAERAARGVAAPAAANVANGTALRTMRDAVETAIKAARWLTPSDEASKAQARMLAEDVDLSAAAGDRAAARAAHRALSRVLNDLGATPSVRLQRELRSRRLVDATGGGDVGNGGGASGKPAGNVSAFKRPEKRAR